MDLSSQKQTPKNSKPSFPAELIYNVIATLAAGDLVDVATAITVTKAYPTFRNFTERQLNINLATTGAELKHWRDVADQKFQASGFLLPQHERFEDYCRMVGQYQSARDKAGNRMLTISAIKKALLELDNF